jgi:hypothetical protein
MFLRLCWRAPRMMIFLSAMLEEVLFFRDGAQQELT